MRFVKTAIASGLLAFVMTASAQSPALRASIPFKFTVNDQVMPAGDYLLKMDAVHTRIELQNMNGTAQAYLPVMTKHTVGGPSKATLSFNTYGRAHFLTTVKAAGTQEGWDLFRSRGEREMAKTSTKTSTEVALVR